MEKYGIPQSLLPGKAYINGTWVSEKAGKTFKVLNPATGELLGEVPDLGAAETEEAIGVAYKTFQTWKETTAKERAKILRKWSELLMANQEHLAKILTLENGKPLTEGKGEIGFSASFFDWYAEEARRTYGDVVPTPAQNKRLVVIRQPVGVAGLITPWNFPAGMIARKVAAALAAGCTTVLKPAEDTPLSALAMAQLAEEAGVPAGVFNVIPCSRPNAASVGKALCESPLVAKISFTGSSATGKLILKQAASTVKKVSMELGATLRLSSSTQQMLTLQ
ncbi:putative succinate-semialdehyde dehydrogenase, mitochondrial [Apostichopus japonicus]|uniref:Putative succinate-semialdehyde dehydrogenase, mitochondrial n=1 Tax=Stichopus japonicus TaxID=307972 RepID=A0A2G8L4U5_STIJA|nr:putative succinate-semialdehyde dehydrogenase, mitochondrial [Apostichopus japonicus]